MSPHKSQCGRPSRRPQAVEVASREDARRCGPDANVVCSVVARTGA
ncbi:hypothetical protein STRAU_3920 [Streptomyces aurantiacus JA 4570]|uniref:Uncharacterized protein n=1 Tax=Streptomyces aurantiacus JA 4570 TaxID=1286094 RepID=S3ZHD7_9ACTN|nr:hypothetical protein STRAU_3920 [Streptomyces aurantiacus JA 4570]